MKDWLQAGTIIAGYEISARLSANGIGEVYLTRELARGREVALKLLPAELLRDEASRARFTQIIAAAAGLHHPHVCEVYAGGVTDDGQPFVALEYVKGQSLDLVNFGRQLPLARVLAVVIQIAEALEFAHRRRWLHLAIKPSNLMLRPSGQPSILDLGLGPAFGRQLWQTRGAARYLSPEQVRGETLDPRTDVFSLGTVCYELLTGQLPFDGSSVDDVAAAILHAQPSPITAFTQEATPELDRVVARALTKDVNARYQTAGEFASALRAVAARKPEWAALLPPLLAEAGEDPKKAARRRAHAAQSTGSDEKEESLPAGSLLDDVKGAMGNLFRATPEEQLIPKPKVELLPERSFTADILYALKNYWQHLLATVLVIAGLIIAVVIGGWMWSHEAGPEVQAPQALQLSPLTATGKVAEAAISPDGATLVYTRVEGGQQSLWSKDLKSKGESRIAAASEVEYRGLTFAPAGDQVAYVKAEATESYGQLCQMPVRGGAEVPLSGARASGSLSFAPDGKRFAFVRESENAAETFLLINTGGSEQVLATRRRPAMFHAINPAWSRNGALIACAVKDADSDLLFKLVTISVAGGSEQVIAAGRWSRLERIAWLAEDRALVVAASEPGAHTTQLWRVAYPSGEITRITHDLSDYCGASLTADARSLVSVQTELLSNLWSAPFAQASQAKQLTTGELDGVGGLAWTPAGSIVYVARAGGNEGIWITQGDGSELQPLNLAPGGAVSGLNHPAVSPDGRFLAYVVARPEVQTSASYLWRSELERRSLRQLADDRLSFFPQFLRDGQTIIYSALRGGRGVLAQSAQGTTTALIDKGVWRPTLAPDGTKIACNNWDAMSGRWRIAVFPVAAGRPSARPLALFDALGDFDRVVQWLPDGSGLAYLVTRGGVSNLWQQPLAGGAPVPLTDFKQDRIFNFAFSPDGQRIAYARGWTTSDAVLIQNFREENR